MRTETHLDLVDATPVTEARQPSSLGAKPEVVSGPLGRAGKDLDPKSRAALLDDLYFEDERRGPYLWRFATLIVLSTAISTFGLLTNSGAVVIGAMLVAPLMTPILATAAALVQGWPRREMEQIGLIAGGVALAIFTGLVLSWLVSPNLTVATLPDQIASRTQPELLCLAIAIAAGAAGGYVSVRREAGGALPGVGIAVALVPPLGVVGITWQQGMTEQAWGAFLLFFTNLVAIVFTAGIVFLLAGFIPFTDAREQRSRLAMRLGGVIVLLALIAIPLTQITDQVLDRHRIQDAVHDSVNSTDTALIVRDVTTDIDASKRQIRAVIVGPDGPPDPDALAADISNRIGKPVDLEISFIREQLVSAQANP